MPDHASTLMLLGLLLVGSVFAGRAAVRLRLPAMTGQLVAGLAIGRACTPWFSTSAEVLLTLRLALGGVLLFWIGSQLTLERLRVHKRAVGSLAAAALMSTLFCAVALALPLPRLFGVGSTEALTWNEVIVAALALSATSPTVIAVLSHEQGTAGRLARNALDASVLANACILLLIFLALGVNESGGPLEVHGGVATSLSLARDLAVGLAVGGAVGAFVSFGSRVIPGTFQVTFAAMAFLLLRQGLLNFEAAITAGSFVAGTIAASSKGDSTLAKGLPRAVPVMSAALFAVAGALAEIGIVIAMAVPAALLFLVRAVSIWLGSRLAGAVVGDAVVRRHGFATLLPQAGFSLAIMGVLAAPNGLSTALSSLVLAVLVINELAMPPVLRLALRASEQGRVTSTA